MFRNEQTATVRYNLEKEQTRGDDILLDHSEEIFLKTEWMWDLSSGRKLITEKV